ERDARQPDPSSFGDRAVEDGLDFLVTQHLVDARQGDVTAQQETHLLAVAEKFGSGVEGGGGAGWLTGGQQRAGGREIGIGFGSPYSGAAETRGGVAGGTLGGGGASLLQ